MVYTRAEDSFRRNLGVLAPDFQWHEGLGEFGKWRLVFKTDIGHKPELELIDLMLESKWGEISGLTLNVAQGKSK